MEREGAASPYWQGFYAARNGEGRDACTYEIGTPESALWTEGWEAAQGDNGTFGEA